MMRWWHRISLSWRYAALACVYMLAAAALVIWLTRWFRPWAAPLVATAILAPFLICQVRSLFGPVRSLFRALAGSVDSYRDGDFSFGIAWHGQGELLELVDSHRELGDTLRKQRHALVQRELLLDTIVQNTPVAMVLVDPNRRVVLGNLAARKVFGDGHRLEGQSFEDILSGTSEAVRDAFARGADGMFTVGDANELENGSEDIYHLSRRTFRLNGRAHELVLLRQLTTELRRQEVQTWKKVIRVISHELNNSLAPIASLAHSGSELLRRKQYERLPIALATIEERARHLEGFIRDYARFAKLPSPRLEPVQWSRVIAQLRTQVEFVSDLTPSDGILRADVAQFEQGMLNLLKNAHESGSAAGDVRLSVRRLPVGWRIEVLDRGSGMNEAVLANALLPFYSTKRNGTGLGLALAREIAEAHGGRIALLNRDGGGLCVSLTLPL
jgi:two-component system nitrogen regulation sensor histidine kinase NtrY